MDKKRPCDRCQDRPKAVPLVIKLGADPVAVWLCYRCLDEFGKWFGNDEMGLHTKESESESDGCARTELPERAPYGVAH